MHLSGSRQAADAKLWIMARRQGDFEKVKPVWSTWGKPFTTLARTNGSHEAGGNHIVALELEALAESLVLAQKRASLKTVME
jgi:3-hydroxyisobutyrate dehydrogenase-like beta-hydroxyacid dehydrogenase